MRKAILVISIVSGLAAAALGPLLGGILALLAWIGSAGQPDALLPAATIAAGLAVLGPAFGLPLAWAGWAALRGRPARPFRLPRWGWWLLALAVVLGLGQAAFTAGIEALVPLTHLLAGVLPAFLFLALALGSARRGGGAITTRPVIGSIAWGGLGGVGLSLIAEVILVLIAGAALILWLAVADSGIVQELQKAALEFQRSGDLQDLSAFFPYLTSPLVTVGILGAIGVVVPLIEEGAKSLAVPLVAGTGRRLARLDGFLLGAAAGAGFTLFEGVMNGALTLSAPDAWALTMAVRGGTAAIHCGAAALCGLGWQAVLSERRLARGLGLGLAAVALHGAWNVFAGAQMLLGMRGLAAGPGPASMPGLLLLGGMGLAWVVAVLLLALLPRRLAGVSQSGSLYPPLGDQGHEAQNEPVDQERVEERPAAPGDPAEQRSPEDRAEGLDLGLAQVRQGEGYRLNDDRDGPQGAQQPE
jgi:PrsW family intramembrane metalloprotease